MKLGHKEINGEFATVSGVGATSLDIILLWARTIPQIGIYTTKSISLKPRDGNKEPIYCQVGERTFRNAVGLTNPGLEAYLEEVKGVYPLPNNKFLLTSIVGEDVDEFVKLAKALSPYTDGFELNVSCPHAKGHGTDTKRAQTESYGDLVAKIVKAVKEVTGKPVIPKLTPNVDNIGLVAKMAEAAGADGISAINTVGPDIAYEPHTGVPILSNVMDGVRGKGGMSGADILERGIECIKEIRENVSIPIIGMGGIMCAEDARRYQAAGADICGIGTALTGMSTEQTIFFFKAFEADLISGANLSINLSVHDWIMKYEPYKIEKIIQVTEDLKVFYFDNSIEAEPGQFVFTWIPDHHEKPFSVADDQPLTLAVRRYKPKEGKNFTSRMFECKEGDGIMVRGPYGNSFPIFDNKIVYLIGGGTGIAPLHFYAKQNQGEKRIFIGATDEKEVLFLDEMEKLGYCYTCIDTDKPGKIISDLSNHLSLINNSDKKDLGKAVFFNCGPYPMMMRAAELESQFTDRDIYLSMETYTKCGVGVCSSCALRNGERTCVDGPVYTLERLQWRR